MQRLYVVPVEYFYQENVTYYGPRYFRWRFGTGTLNQRGSILYGYIQACLVLGDVTQAEHDALILNADVFDFPENLGANIDSGDMQALRDWFEALNIPTNWLTPANTYRELIRQTGAMFRFSTNYARISTEVSLANNQGALAYTGTTFTDAGQDFTNWATASGQANYRLVALVDTLQGIQPMWGYIGPANSATEVQIYLDKELSLPGWREPDNIIGLESYDIYLSEVEKLLEVVALDDRYRNFPAQTQLFFDATVVEFGYPSNIIKPNSTLRQMLKLVGDVWAAQPFTLGGQNF